MDDKPWQIVPGSSADWGFWIIVEGDRPVGGFCTKEDAKRIVSDHAKAALADEVATHMREADSDHCQLQEDTGTGWLARYDALKEQADPPD